MTLDLLTLILSGVLLVLALLTPMSNPFFRRLRRSTEATTGEGPKVTVLLISNGDHTALDEHLPIYLTQDYAPGYEVVVVSEKADAESENVLKRYSQNPRLYHTFVPESSRYMSKNKLAITLGVKAAKNEWIILTDPRCKPTDEKWIESFTHEMTSGSHVVLGYVNYAEDAKAYHRFERLHTAIYALREAQQDRAYRTNCPLVAFRKSEFMERNGFLEYLRYSIGEYDFIVDKFGREAHCEVATSPTSWLTENSISARSWQNRQVYYHEVGRHISGGTWAGTLRTLDQLLLHGNYLLEIGACVFAGITGRWVLLGAAAVSLLLTFVLRTLIGRKALKEFGIHIPIWKIVPMETGILRQHILTRLRYEYADKNDFISHKV